jgi:hypothetical protein
MDNILHAQPQQLNRGSADKITEIWVDTDETAADVCLRNSKAYLIKNGFELLFVILTHLITLPSGSVREPC